jgi:hypothetical protein
MKLPHQRRQESLNLTIHVYASFPRNPWTTSESAIDTYHMMSNKYMVHATPTVHFGHEPRLDVQLLFDRHFRGLYRRDIRHFEGVCPHFIRWRYRTVHFQYQGQGSYIRGRTVNHHV